MTPTWEQIDHALELLGERDRKIAELEEENKRLKSLIRNMECIGMSTHTHSVNAPTRRRLKISALEERLGVHRQTIWRWTRAGVLPPPHYLGAERQWFEDEVIAWENERMAQRAEEKAAM